MTGFNAWLIVDVKIVPAVQEERQRNKEKGEGDVESTSPANADMPVEKVLEAELAVEPQTDTYIDAQVTKIDHLLIGLDKQKKNRHNMLIFSYPYFLAYVLGAQKNCIIERVLLSTNNI